MANDISAAALSLTAAPLVSSRLQARARAGVFTKDGLLTAIRDLDSVRQAAPVPQMEIRMQVSRDRRLFSSVGETSGARCCNASLALLPEEAATLAIVSNGEAPNRHDVTL